MGTKKAKKQKRKAINDIDNQIIDTMSETLKETIKPRKKGDLSGIGKMLALGFKMKALSDQKQMIASQPIQPKKNKFDGFRETPITPLSEFIVGKEETESILNSPECLFSVHTPITCGMMWANHFKEAIKDTKCISEIKKIIKDY